MRLKIKKERAHMTRAHMTRSRTPIKTSERVRKPINTRQQHHLFAVPSVVCFETGSYAHPKQVPQTVRSCASSFSSQYHLVSLRSSICLHHLPRFPVTSKFPYIVPSITCFRSSS